MERVKLLKPVVMSAKELFRIEKERIKKEVQRIKEHGYTPGLAAIIACDEPRELETAKLFVSKKNEDCSEIGIYFEAHHAYRWGKEEREERIAELIERLNNRDDISGIIIQKPLPDFIDENRLVAMVDSTKDVDGLTPKNKGILVSEYDFNNDLLPCTAAGIIELLKYYNVKIEGRFAVIVGRSDLVGRPLRILLEDEDATVVCLHRKSPNSEELIKQADIVVCAAGRPPELYKEKSFRLKGDMVKEGVVAVNVGMKMDPNTRKLYFDIDFKSVSEKASYITPNLGSTGLMTRLRLLKNLMIASRSQIEKVKP